MTSHCLALRRLWLSMPTFNYPQVNYLRSDIPVVSEIFLFGEDFAGLEYSEERLE
jgi:hypothetical protein